MAAVSNIRDVSGTRQKPRPLRLTDARAPHVATGAVVKRQGEECARVLYAAFAEYNARFFEGKLGSPLILITQAHGFRAALEELGGQTP